MKIGFEKVTPDIAREWLTHNTRNRTVSTNRINMLVSDMKNNKWTEASLDPISFSSCGQLLNGQHRLMSIVRSGVTLNMLVARDVPEDAVFDRGMERNSFQELYMRGIISKRYTSWCAKAVVNFIMFCSIGRNNFSDSERAEFIKQNDEYLDKVFDIVKIDRGKIKGNKNMSKRAPVACAIFYAFKWGVSEDDLNKFAEAINTGFIDDETQSAAIVCRNYLLNTNESWNNYRAKIEAMKVTEMAIRDFVCNKPRKIMYKNPQHLFVEMKEHNEIYK